MTENKLRRKIVRQMQDWLGLRENDYSNQPILDIYNSIAPLPRGYRMLHGTPWCAAAVSAAEIKAGLGKFAVCECSCSRMISLAREKGVWTEKDSHIPLPGDFCVYDWDDSGAGDCTGDPEHIGVVETVSGGVITVIEGNKGPERAVGRRTVPVDGQYIRGFICPDYAGAAQCKQEKEEEPKHGTSALPMMRDTAVHVFYSLRTEKGWTDWITEKGSCADTGGLAITGIAIWADKGTVRYRVHLAEENRWLPYVTGCNLADAASGFAGSGHFTDAGKIIDAVEICYETPDCLRRLLPANRPSLCAAYRVQAETCSGFWDWQADNDTSRGQDGYAGTLGGTALVRFQLEVVSRDLEPQPDLPASTENCLLPGDDWPSHTGTESCRDAHETSE